MSIMLHFYGNGISIYHMKLATGVSSSRFWGLILKEIYSQENIMVPSGVENAEFLKITTPRVSVDDANLFPNFSRILDSMLKLVDLKDQLLVQYLASIDSSYPTVVIPPKVSHKGVEGTSKASKAPKKKNKVEQP